LVYNIVNLLLILLTQKYFKILIMLSCDNGRIYKI